MPAINMNHHAKKNVASKTLTIFVPKCPPHVCAVIAPICDLVAPFLYVLVKFNSVFFASKVDLTSSNQTRTNPKK